MYAWEEGIQLKTDLPWRGHKNWQEFDSIRLKVPNRWYKGIAIFLLRVIKNYIWVLAVLNLVVLGIDVNFLHYFINLGKHYMHFPIQFWEFIDCFVSRLDSILDADCFSFSSTNWCALKLLHSPSIRLLFA